MPDEIDALLDPVEPPEEDSDEIPPTPAEAAILSNPSLHERREAAFREMQADPERKARYDAAQAEIMANPAVAAFAEEEDRRRAEKAATQAAFLAAYRKKQKEKA